MILADSDVLIEILDKKSKRGDEAIKRILESGTEVCTTVINIHEVLFGLYKYGKSVKEILQLPIFEYTKKDALLSSRLELEAEKNGTPLHRTDAMIGAIAINNGASLYTFDLKHFASLKNQGLKIFPE
ncbi:MAG: type II toxin-antitoxin system VapC family toxin [Candidatus Bathyarchaeia archaeon]|jgi:predicted nucleic acid-binding protein